MRLKISLFFFSKFSTIKSNLNNLQRSLIPNEEEESQKQKIQNIQSWINGLYESQSYNSVIFSNTLTGKLIYDQYSISKAQGDGALFYFRNSPLNANQITSNKDYLKGFVAAQEFDQQGSPKGIKRKKITASSFDSIHNKYEQKLYNLQKNHTDFATEIADWQESVVEENTEWKNTTQEKHIKTVEEQITRLIELEKLYQEKLRLEAPVVYWQKRSKEHQTAGYCWLGGLIASIVIFITLLIVILYNPPSLFSQNVFKFEPGAVKGVVIMLAILSAAAYAIKILATLTLSNFHLSTDAKERENLTYVYLALIQSKAISDQERNIVLQSLFSRANTGLLGDQGAPEMPGINQIFDKLQFKS